MIFDSEVVVSDSSVLVFETVQFCFCDDWDATYGIFSPVNIPPWLFWAMDANLKKQFGRK